MPIRSLPAMGSADGAGPGVDLGADLGRRDRNVRSKIQAKDLKYRTRGKFLVVAFYTGLVL